MASCSSLFSWLVGKARILRRNRRWFFKGFPDVFQPLAMQPGAAMHAPADQSAVPDLADAEQARPPRRRRARALRGACRRTRLAAARSAWPASSGRGRPRAGPAAGVHRQQPGVARRRVQGLQVVQGHAPARGRSGPTAVRRSAARCAPQPSACAEVLRQRADIGALAAADAQRAAGRPRTRAVRARGSCTRRGARSTRLPARA